MEELLELSSAVGLADRANKRKESFWGKKAAPPRGGQAPRESPRRHRKLSRRERKRRKRALSDQDLRAIPRPAGEKDLLEAARRSLAESTGETAPPAAG